MEGYQALLSLMLAHVAIAFVLNYALSTFSPSEIYVQSEESTWSCPALLVEENIYGFMGKRYWRFRLCPMIYVIRYFVYNV